MAPRRKVKKSKSKKTNNYAGKKSKIPSWLKSSASDIFALSKSKGHGRSELLRHVPNKSVHAICQCAHDMLVGKVPLKAAHKRKLKPHKNKIIRLLKPGISIDQRKKILQKGGFLGPLTAVIASVIPTIASLFAK